MNNLVVKKVPFYGAELLAVQEKGTGKIYAGINSILRDLTRSRLNIGVINGFRISPWGKVPKNFRGSS